MSRLPIEAYIEAILTPSLCSPKLARMSLLDSRHTMRSFGLTSEHIIFYLTDGTDQWTLTLPLGESFGLPREQIRARVAQTSRTEFFAESIYLPTALTIFDSNGVPHTREGLLQRAYIPAMEFLRTRCAPKHKLLLRSALQNIVLTSAQMLLRNIKHGALTRQRILFNHNGELFLSDFPLTTDSRGEDMARLGEVALALFVVGCQPDVCRHLLSQSTSQEVGTRRLRQILSAAEHHAIEPPARLTKLLLQERATSESLHRAIVALAEEPFCPMPLLSRLLQSSEEEGVVVVENPIQHEEEPIERIDFSLCDEVFQSDNIVRYRKGALWGYAHYDGERIPTRALLIAAYDFVEGRAVVRTQRGYGLIDTSGRMVMNDVWEDMAWYGDENIATACDKSGNWHIFDRLGRQLSAVAAEWMGDISEGFIVARRGRKFGYYSADGQRRTDFIYDEAFSFSEGTALVERNGIRYHIDTSFHRLSTQQEERVKLRIEN